MTALRFFTSTRPSLIGAPVLPMNKQDEAFWKLLSERRKERK